MFLCLISCDLLSSEKDSKKEGSEQTEAMKEEEEEDFEVPSTQKPKAFYATILDDFCTNHYSDCYSGYTYVENSLTIIQVEYVSNEEAEVVGTHSYILPSGLQYTGEKFKAVVKDSTGATSEVVYHATVSESLPLTNISTINTGTSVSVNKTITIAGRTVGGTKPCTFEFYFKRSVNSKWNKLSYGNDKKTYAKFTPTSAASYDLKCVATDADGTVSVKTYTITAS